MIFGCLFPWNMESHSLMKNWNLSGISWIYQDRYSAEGIVDVWKMRAQLFPVQYLTNSIDRLAKETRTQPQQKSAKYICASVCLCHTPSNVSFDSAFFPMNFSVGRNVSTKNKIDMLKNHHFACSPSLGHHEHIVDLRSNLHFYMIMILYFM